MVITYGIILIALGLLAYAVFEYSFLLPPVNGLPIIMYHKIEQNKRDGLTVSTAMFRRQCEYLQKKGLTTLFFTELIALNNAKVKPPRKSLILTFDDGYLNNLTQALPILQEFKFRATIFISPGLALNPHKTSDPTDQLMSVDQMRTCYESGLIEFAYHAYDHGNYGTMSPAEIEQDIKLCFKTAKEFPFPVTPVLAYPYGAYPRKDPKKSEMKKVILQNGITMGIRIGSRINRLPLRDLFEIQRIKIRGQDRFFEFVIKMRKGRTKVFS